MKKLRGDAVMVQALVSVPPHCCQRLFSFPEVVYISRALLL